MSRPPLRQGGGGRRGARMASVPRADYQAFGRADMITADMCHALELICGEQTRYLIPAPAMVPDPNPS